MTKKMHYQIIFFITFLHFVYSSNITINKDVETFLLDYQNEHSLNFENEAQCDRIVMIHSINCKIGLSMNLDSSSIILSQNNDDNFALKINNENSKELLINISPLKYIKNEEDLEKYKFKKCPIVITNICSEFDYSINLNDTANIYFDNNFKEVNLSYIVNEPDLDSPIALSLTFNLKSDFEVKILSENGNFSENISNSTNIFFEKDFRQNKNFTINIKYIDNENQVFMNIKIIKNTSISILEQNNLNYGFITSDIEYQYYYMEVSKGQEGEIMLHNKRNKGILIGKLFDKDDKIDINDINIYPKYENDSNLLFGFNQHNLKLNFSYNDTKICNNSCYMLISYFKEIPEGTIERIGYEYTILTRVWDYLEYNPQIINIPFNEYILGSFEYGSITHHYYSIFIPNDTEKIVIQLEGNYLVLFIGEGNMKLNTIKNLKNVKKIDILNNQNVFEITNKDLNFDFRNKYISLAIRSKDYFEDIFSFYYFRIFYLKQNDILYYPIDSNLGNLCLPEKESESDKYYYCNFILKNNYNDFSSNFSIAGANHIEFFLINYSKVYKNNTMTDLKYVEFKYTYDKGGKENDVSHFLFKFRFDNNKIKNIISAFCDKFTNIFPQIYSSQMYYLYNSTKVFNFSLVHDYTFLYKFIGGWQGSMDLNFQKFREIVTSRNFRGKPIALQISPETKNMTFWVNKRNLIKDYIFYIKLNYNMRNKGAEEIISGETRSEIIRNGYFPIYYYLNLNKKTEVNVDINIRLNSYDVSNLSNDFEIKGYILNQDSITRKIRGENILLTEEDAINGLYFPSYKMGLLQINKKTINEDYILISILHKGMSLINDTYFLVETITNEHLDDIYFMPINQYILDSFDINETSSRKENKYYLDFNDKYNSNTGKNNSILIEFSPNYNDLELTFEGNLTIKKNNVNGFQKYRILDSPSGNIYFNITNNNNINNASYMIRYYYSEENLEDIYIVDLNYEKKVLSSDDNNINISLRFKSIDVQVNGSSLDPKKSRIYFDINADLFPKQNLKGEILNTSSIIYKEPLYSAETSYEFGSKNNYNFTFTNISRKDNFVYEVRLKINSVIEDNIFDEEFLAYTFELDLTDIEKDDNKTNIWTILIPIIVVILLAIISLIFLFKYRKLRRDNTQLKEKVLSKGYTSGLVENVLTKEEKSRKDQDYETTFM